MQTLVSSGFEQNISMYRQRDDNHKLPKPLSYAVLTFIDLYKTKDVSVFFLFCSFCVWDLFQPGCPVEDIRHFVFGQ